MGQSVSLGRVLHHGEDCIRQTMATAVAIRQAELLAGPDAIVSRRPLAGSVLLD